MGENDNPSLCHAAAPAWGGEIHYLSGTLKLFGERELKHRSAGNQLMRMNGQLARIQAMNASWP
jgi:hypothetical protein